MTTRRGFLEGTRVLDLSNYIPGPYASLSLSDLGAEVVKIEPPGGDLMRGWGPLDRDGVSSFYKVLNAGKTVCRADLKDPARRREVLALIAQSDVLIESYRPNVLARLGLDRATLAEANPRLIHCALSGFGQKGPYHARAGHDINYMALSGGLSISGTPEWPVMAVPPTSDYAAALQAALTITAALVTPRERRTGVFIDIAVSDAVLAWQACALSSAARGASFFRRGEGEESGGLARYRIYAASDGRFVALGPQEPKFWAIFCRRVGQPGWVDRADDPVPQTALIKEVEAMFASAPATYWEALLSDADCCFNKVLEPLELLSDPHVAQRGMLAVKGEDEPRVEVLYPAWIDDVPPAERKAFAEAEIETLRRAWMATDPS